MVNTQSLKRGDSLQQIASNVNTSVLCYVGDPVLLRFWLEIANSDLLVVKLICYFARKMGYIELIRRLNFLV